ncbi:hypothetical protein [Solimonas sp. SE-A11]|uniref:hypothetical protein n=1 Tax=Solimonas sp. SE-A11 TaxID=3054954 RepID=UPI00259C9F86|nr:hypothetical protein [Solimonas sp. SE-A11]MDM4769897.1 hypothetical protein [Solimonas sp. SE-A11]
MAKGLFDSPLGHEAKDEIVAVGEPLAVALHGVNRAQLKLGGKVVVFGCGPVGLGMILWLKDRGIDDVVALDQAPERLQRARVLDAEEPLAPAVPE